MTTDGELDKTGGPALTIRVTRPTSQENIVSVATFEVELSTSLFRDWFAGLAMQGILDKQSGFLVDVGTDNVATWAYRIADNMLAEREKGEHEAP